MPFEYHDIADFLPDDDDTGGVEDLPGIKHYFGEENPFYEYLKAAKTEWPKGANIVGALHLKWKAMWSQLGLKEFADNILTTPEPKQINYGFKNESYRWGTGNPIAYDIWYLFYAGDVILKSKPDDYSDQEWMDEVLDKRLESYISEIDTAKTLKPLLQPPRATNVDLYPISEGGGAGGSSGGSVTIKGFSGLEQGWPMRSTIVADWQHAIKEARFETMVKGYGRGVFTSLKEPNPFQINDEPYWKPKPGEYDSTDHPPLVPYGPKEPHDKPYAGYIAFPVGPIGVMWQISLASESALSDGKTNVHPANYETTVIQGNQLLPPFNLKQTKAAGESLIEKGYVTADHSVVELTAERFDEVDNPALHYWLRYWIKADNEIFWPGEFVSLLCRPWPLHCWFYQKSAPLIYSGSWIETEFYTSGVVKCVLEMWTEEGDPPSISKSATEGYYDIEDWDICENARLYVVWVKNEEIIVSSSDWLEYEVGDRVGLLKCVRDGDEATHVNALGAAAENPGPGTHFDWQGLEWFRFEKKSSRDEDMFTKEWVIVPVDFFPSGGLGGA